MFKNNRNRGKKSFFSNLPIFGGINKKDDLEDEYFEDEEYVLDGDEEYGDEFEDDYEEEYGDEDEDNEVEESVPEISGRELLMDMVNEGDNIVVLAPLPGMELKDIDVIVTRELVTIKAETMDEHIIKDSDYVSKELYWGKLSRSMVLPQEVDVDGVKAELKSGILKVTLPKLDKKKKTKVKVKKG